MPNINTKAFFFSFLALCAFAIPAAAQSSATDVAPAGSHYVEVDYASHMTTPDAGGFHDFCAHYLYGAGHSVQLGVNIEDVHPIVEDQGVELQPNAKWQFYANERRGVSAAVATTLYLPVMRRGGTDTFVCVSGSVSKVLSPVGPKVSAGYYALLGRDPQYGARVRPTFNVTQPLSKKVNFSVDWVTGSNRYGFVSAGFAVQVSPSTSVTFGYAFGNEGRGNNQIGSGVGYAF